MPLGPPLIYFLQNCCLFFTDLLDEGYVLDARQGPPIVEERRVRRQAGDLGRQKKNGSVSSYQTGAASQASGSGSVSDYATWQVEFNR